MTPAPKEILTVDSIRQRLQTPHLDDSAKAAYEELAHRFDFIVRAVCANWYDGIEMSDELKRIFRDGIQSGIDAYEKEPEEYYGEPEASFGERNRDVRPR